jgi:predicted acylesterase/phospholipase RssA
MKYRKERVVTMATTSKALVLSGGALPGVYPLVTIGRRRYADGGAHSLYNADLAAGHDVVTVLSPMPLNDYLRAKLDAEVAAAGARAHRPGRLTRRRTDAVEPLLQQAHSLDVRAEVCGRTARSATATRTRVSGIIR